MLLSVLRNTRGKRHDSICEIKFSLVFPDSASLITSWPGPGMSRGYDTQTTTFSPDGRIFQIEYAIEAIAHAPPAVALVLGKDAAPGVLIATVKAQRHSLVDTTKSAAEKTLRITDDIVCCAAGLVSDANILVAHARNIAQKHLGTYNCPIAFETLVREVCDVKQFYTQHGGLRPYGVSFLWAGWDEREGFQLFRSDPSGNYSEWLATSIGGNEAAAASILKQEYPTLEKEGGVAAGELTLEHAEKIAKNSLEKATEGTALLCDSTEMALLVRKGGKTHISLIAQQ
ncbi:MAG: 20S proteasome subunit alpha 3, PSMA4 [Amphiamblys sp. WSBS2006]|nr:MAG: 20S proteasome subunit alpha 3, PSMA4 [Amphiamblys sp. WSBS2006]